MKRLIRDTVEVNIQCCSGRLAGSVKRASTPDFVVVSSGPTLGEEIIQTNENLKLFNAVLLTRVRKRKNTQTPAKEIMDKFTRG